jgi:hypothetical protein
MRDFSSITDIHSCKTLSTLIRAILLSPLKVLLLLTSK